MNNEHRCRVARWTNALVVIGIAGFAGCGSGADGDPSIGPANVAGIVPAFEDANANGLNDYYERDDHAGDATNPARRADTRPDHDFIDEDGDSVCDFAQDGSRTWHGPGFLDANNDGICDYWDADRPEFNQNGGLLYEDRDADGRNDFMQRATHEGNGHEFVDADDDGLCDVAQDGRLESWHGPNFIDEDDDGACDLWEEGGRAHGRGGHRGGDDGVTPADDH